jgi:hypothetical protein
LRMEVKFRQFMQRKKMPVQQLDHPDAFLLTKYHQYLKTNNDPVFLEWILSNTSPLIRFLQNEINEHATEYLILLFMVIKRLPDKRIMFDLLKEGTWLWHLDNPQINARRKALQCVLFVLEDEDLKFMELVLARFDRVNPFNSTRCQFCESSFQDVQYSKLVLFIAIKCQQIAWSNNILSDKCEDILNQYGINRSQIDDLIILKMFADHDSDLIRILQQITLLSLHPLNIYKIDAILLFVKFVEYCAFDHITILDIIMEVPMAKVYLMEICKIIDSSKLKAACSEMSQIDPETDWFLSLVNTINDLRRLLDVDFDDLENAFLVFDNME